MIRLLKARIGAKRDQGRVVAELKPVQQREGISLSRWSRLKRAAAEEQAAASSVVAEPAEALVASEQGSDCLSPTAKNDAAASAEYAELPPMSAISLAEDFTPFMQAKVPQALKRQALKALFKEPHFNVMDGLDIYIDDYTVFEPISPEVMATLSSWKTIMNPPQQVVTDGGYAVDVESEEGRAVLAARAELDQASAAPQPPGGGVEVPSPTARQSAEGEGHDVPMQTSQTSDELSLDMPDESPSTVPMTALSPTPAHTCAPVRERGAGEAAKAHPRYGKRVGDFSASAHETAEAAARESSASELVETANATPRSIIQ